MKLDEINVLAAEYNFDVICLTETWLDNSIDANSIRLVDYRDPFRLDRNRHGGVVLAYVKNNIYCDRPFDFESPDVEILWLELQTINSRSLYLVVSYLSANTTFLFKQTFIQLLNQLLYGIMPKENFSDLHNALYATPWEFIIMYLPNVDCALLNVTDVINQTLKTFIPKKIIYPSKRNKPWFNDEIKTLIRKRTRYYKRWRKTNNMNCKRLYNKLRNLIQRKIKLAKQSHNMSYINKLNTTNKSHADYWSLLNQFWKPTNNATTQ